MPPKILIVEDDPVTRHILHRILKSEKYETILAPDAMTALTSAQKEKPDLILLDLGLPAGGGFGFLERLKHFPALEFVPVIVVSGYDPATFEPRAAAAGVVAYLQKPARPDELLATVKRVLGK